MGGAGPGRARALIYGNQGQRAEAALAGAADSPAPDCLPVEHCPLGQDQGPSGRPCGMATKELPLVSKEVVAKDTMAFRFRKHDLHYQAGQAADFTVMADGKAETHTFTISSSPDNPDTILVTTRMRDSPFK